MPALSGDGSQWCTRRFRFVVVGTEAGYWRGDRQYDDCFDMIMFDVGPFCFEMRSMSEDQREKAVCW